MSRLMLTLETRDSLPAAGDAGFRHSTSDFRQNAGPACRRGHPAYLGGDWTLAGMEFADPMKTAIHFGLCAIAIFWLTGATLAQTQTREISLNFVPAKTSVNFTLGDVLHTVHGSFNVKSGNVHFDPASNKISGEILVDAASGHSGSDGRDKKMHSEVLESARYPEIAFRPDRVEGRVADLGASTRSMPP